MAEKVRSELWQGFMSLSDEILRNFCKRDKIPAVVVMRGAEDYEPSYKGLKHLDNGIGNGGVDYEPSYKGLKLSSNQSRFRVNRITNLPIRD